MVWHHENWNSAGLWSDRLCGRHPKLPLFIEITRKCWILSHLLLFYNFSGRTRQLIIHIHRESVMNPPDTRSIQTTTNLLFKCLLNFLAKHVLVPLSDSNHFCWTQQNPIKPQVKHNRRQGSRYSWKVESQHLRDIAQFLSVCFWAREKEHGS